VSVDRELVRASSAGNLGLKGKRIATLVLSALIALKIAFFFIFALNSRFVMDEFLQLGWAKYLGNVFESIWPAKAVGFAVFYKLAHLIGWDAQSILLIGRMQTALLACATMAIIYACARALGESRLRALAIILVLLCFSNFIERIFRTIAEPLAVFFAAASLLVVLRGRADRARTVIAAGVLTGMAFLATQKSVYFNIALGLALVGDAALAGRFIDGIKRGGWLMLGWLLPLIGYCFIFGGSDPLPVAQNLILGPVDVAAHGDVAYGGLRGYVGKTILYNGPLYIFCFSGMGLALLRVRMIDERTRVALIFTLVISLLVFAHNQPWPYVFIMSLPFMSLWSLELFDRLAGQKLHLKVAWTVMGIAIIASLIRNGIYLLLDNRGQLELVGRAEALVGPGERYFDGVGMLPNRLEPTLLWLDRSAIRKTLREGEHSEAYRVFTNCPPKIILWSYRMQDIYPVVAPLIRNSYVQVAPNIRMVGLRLKRGQPMTFDVPVGGSFALYGTDGEPLLGKVEIDGKALGPPFRLDRGSKTVTLRSGPPSALLLPQGSYAGILTPGNDDERLFAGLSL